MRTYRTGWLVAGIALLLVGVGAAAHGSPRALLIAFVVVAVACSLVRLIAVGIRGTARPRRVRARFVATSALVGGTVAVALVGFAALLGQRVGLLAFVVLVSSPPPCAPTADGCARFPLPQQPSWTRLPAPSPTRAWGMSGFNRSRTRVSSPTTS